MANPTSLTGVQRLHQDILAGGIAIVSVNSSGIVAPSSLQGAAQPIIDAFDPSPAADAVYLQQQAVKQVGAIFGRRKTSDQATSSASFVDVTDLQFTLAPNTHYYWRFSGAYIAALTTTGVALSVNGPASPSFLRYVGKIFTGSTAIAAAAAANYDVLTPAGNSGGATPLPFDIEGTISTNSAGGIFTLRCASEVGGSAVTILRGSIGELRVLA